MRPYDILCKDFETSLHKQYSSSGPGRCIFAQMQECSLAQQSNSHQSLTSFPPSSSRWISSVVNLPMDTLFTLCPAFILQTKMSWSVIETGVGLKHFSRSQNLQHCLSRHMFCYWLSSLTTLPSVNFCAAVCRLWLMCAQVQ